MSRRGSITHPLCCRAKFEGSGPLTLEPWSKDRYTPRPNSRFTEFVVYKSPDDGTGRHTGLKILGSKGRAGSTPALGTIYIQLLIFIPVMESFSWKFVLRLETMTCYGVYGKFLPGPSLGMRGGKKNHGQFVPYCALLRSRKSHIWPIVYDLPVHTIVRG